MYRVHTESQNTDTHTTTYPLQRIKLQIRFIKSKTTGTPYRQDPYKVTGNSDKVPQGSVTKNNNTQGGDICISNQRIHQHQKTTT